MFQRYIPQNKKSLLAYEEQAYKKLSDISDAINSAKENGNPLLFCLLPRAIEMTKELYLTLQGYIANHRNEDLSSQVSELFTLREELNHLCGERFWATIIDN